MSDARFDYIPIAFLCLDRLYFIIYAMDAYTIKIDAFEGPFDLLFHLIEKNKVDIYDIPISLIADQYLDYVAAMHEMDLDIASEFLVMAATLMHIKSRMLLPVMREEGDGEEEDPRNELVISILEYRKYKEFSASLRDNAAYWGEARYRAAGIDEAEAAYGADGARLADGTGGTVGTGGSGIAADAALAPTGNMGIGSDAAPGGNMRIAADQFSFFDMDRNRLLSVYRDLLEARRRRHENVTAKVGRSIEREQVTMSEKIKEILNYLARKPRFLFQKLFNASALSKLDVIVGFNALLELSQQNLITLRQKRQFGGLLVSRRERKRSVNNGK